MTRPALRVAATAMVVATGFAVIAAPGQAEAHSSLIGTTPKKGGTVSSPMEKVTLRFNEDIQAKFATVAVTDPDGHKVSAGKPEVDGGTVAQPVDAFGATGKYLVGWRVVSADGHPVSGEFSFKVASGAVSSSPTSTSTSASPSSTPSATAVAKKDATDDRSFAERHAAHLLIGVVIVLAGVAVIIWERRRRHD